MKNKTINLNYKGKKYLLKVKQVGFFREAWGLMFVPKLRAKPLVFEFEKSTKMAIHSWFVFFPFIAIWLDANNNILEFKIVKPFKFHISPSIKYNKLVEVPLISKYAQIMKFLVGNKKFKQIFELYLIY